jgi:hypothetical protein
MAGNDLQPIDACTSTSAVIQLLEMVRLFGGRGSERDGGVVRNQPPLSIGYSPREKETP